VASRVSRDCSVGCPQPKRSHNNRHSAGDSRRYNLRCSVRSLSAPFRTLSQRMSRAVDSDDLALIWPIFNTRNQTRPDWILTHINPFLAIAFVAAQKVIEKPRLPETLQSAVWHLRRRMALSDKNSVQVALQSFHPLAELHRLTDADKEMNVI